MGSRMEVQIIHRLLTWMENLIHSFIFLSRQYGIISVVPCAARFYFAYEQQNPIPNPNLPSPKQPVSQTSLSQLFSHLTGNSSCKVYKNVYCRMHIANSIAPHLRPWQESCARRLKSRLHFHVNVIGCQDCLTIFSVFLFVFVFAHINKVGYSHVCFCSGAVHD